MGRKYGRRGNGHHANAMEELVGRSSTPRSVLENLPNVKELKPGDLVSLGEVSINTQSVFGQWAASAQAYNPQDSLIGRKGMEVYDQMRTDDAIKACLKLK